MNPRLWPVFALVLGGALLCGNVSFAAETNSSSAAKSTPEVPQFTSAFENYKAFQDQPVGDWKKANDEVGRIGGWRAYAREASEVNEITPPASKATPPTPADKPAPMHPHAGHAKP